MTHIIRHGKLQVIRVRVTPLHAAMGEQSYTYKHLGSSYESKISVLMKLPWENLLTLYDVR